MGVENLDTEGRMLTVEFEDFYLVTCYTPCSGMQLEKLDYRVKEWDETFFKHMNALNQTQKGVIICGDLNVAA